MTFDEWHKKQPTAFTFDLRKEDHGRVIWDAATKAEREACAAICDRFAARDMHPAECAEAIRMRSNVEVSGG